MEELYRKYRPQTFEEMVGNELTIKSLKKELENGSHVFLFQGSSGTGKSSLARIVAKEVGADELSIHEINSADNRGIDTAREIMEQMRYAPLNGNALVYVLDECFEENTLVDVEGGRRKISELSVGDKVYTSNGLSVIDKVWRNKVDLNRLCIVKLSSGCYIITTVDHLFYTSDGWIQAKNLTKESVLYERAISEDMCDMRKALHGKTAKGRLLFKEVQTKENTDATCSKACGEDLSNMRKDIYGGETEKVLFKGMFECSETSEKAHGRREITSGREDTGLLCVGQINRESQEIKRTHEEKQSCSYGRCCGKDASDEAKEWHFGCSEILQGRKRTVYSSTGDTIQCLEGTLSNRIGASDKDRSVKQEGNRQNISDKLQGGYSFTRVPSGIRGGWPDTQLEGDTPEGLKENCKIAGIRVESIEIYERGNSEKPQWSFITDTDRDRGYVYFYDLDVRDYHNYFVEGVLVHNCHQMNATAQNAFLKALEDTPDYVYFFLCTTDPQKLIAPLKTRCSVINLKPLSDDEMSFLIKRTARAEKKKVSPEVVEKIISIAQGSGRQALKTLAKVLYLDSDEEMLKILSSETSDDSAECIALCRLLMNANCSWAKLAPVLKDLDLSDAERIRQAVMGYMSAVLLKGNANNQAMAALQAFSSADTYRNNKHAIIVACLDYLTLLGK